MPIHPFYLFQTSTKFWNEWRIQCKIIYMACLATFHKTFSHQISLPFFFQVFLFYRFLHLRVQSTSVQSNSSKMLHLSIQFISPVHEEFKIIIHQFKVVSGFTTCVGITRSRVFNHINPWLNWRLCNTTSTHVLHKTEYYTKSKWKMWWSPCMNRWKK